MIQRIQSLYLFISAMATAAMYFLNMYIAKIEGAKLLVGLMGADLISDVDGTTIESTSHVYVGIVAILAITLSLATIFMFNNRPLQMKLARLASLIHTALLVALLFLAVESARTMASAVALNGGNEIMGDYALGALLPIIGMVLCFLAGRAIMKDEALVRSASRLR